MLKDLWREWKRVSRHIGSFNGRALMTRIHFTILALVIAISLLGQATAVGPFIYTLF